MRRNWQRRRSDRIPFESLEARNLLAGMPQLLADINTQQSGQPGSMVEFQGRLYYTATHADFGREIWSTDGTAAGTQLLADIVPGTSGSSPSGLVVSGDYLYFTAYRDDVGTEVWRTDGTAGGTQLLKDIAPGYWDSLDSFSEMIDVGGTLFFVADDGDVEGLWKSNGTAAGTELVKSISNWSFSISDLVAVGNTLYFLGDDSIHGQELWKSDGTAAGTVMVKDIEPGSSRSWARQLTAYNGQLYFTAYDVFPNHGLLKSNGTAAGTVRVDVPAGLTIGSGEFVVSGGWLYFAARTSAAGSELWRTNGTLAGTSLVADLEPGAIGSAPANLFDADGTLYFTATVGGEMKLFRTNGTAAGTTALTSLEKNGIAPLISDMVAYGGELYFTTLSSVFGADLWRSNGSSFGTYPFQSGIMTAGWSTPLTVAAGQLFFTSTVGGTGSELWRTNGSYAGTARVIDFAPTGTDSSSPQSFVTAGDYVYFTADDGFGENLWVSDGTPGNAVRLTQSAFGVQSSEIEQMTPVGDLLYFAGRDMHGRRYLGVSDGTPQGTRPLSSPAGVSELSTFELTPFEDGVFFTVVDPEQGFLVLKADQQAIEIVHALGPGWSLPPNYSDWSINPVAWQGHFYFVASGAGSSEIWRTDGTTGGTVRLSDTLPVGSNVGSLTVTDSALYFFARSAGPAGPAGLWRTDGTVAGTYPIAGAPKPQKMLGVGDKLFFTTQWFPSDAVLWVTDGTVAGTIMLGEIIDENSGISLGKKAAALGTELYYIGPPSSPFQYAALWKSDGTQQGTSRVMDLDAYGSAQYVFIDRIKSQLLIKTSWDVFISDGTAEGTQHLVRSHASPSEPLQGAIAYLEGNFFFNHLDSFGALEPHFLEYQLPSATVTGRHLFYNQSKFDGLNAGLNDADDNAIAPDKAPYLAGSGIATFGNISSYSRGINGVMVDLANIPPASSPATLTLADFVFRVGTSIDVSTWVTAPAPHDFLIRFPTGDPNEVTRVSFQWTDNAIANTWLEVTVLANERTGLLQPDVFYFGNRIGDTGLNSPMQFATTTASDALMARTSIAPKQPITSVADFNRDGAVTAIDELIARGNAGSLRKLNLPAPGVSGAGLPAPNLAAPLAMTLHQGSTLDAVGHPVAAAFLSPLATTASFVAVPGADREASHDRGISRALAQHWLKLASDSLEDSPLEASLLDVLTAARARRGVRG